MESYYDRINRQQNTQDIEDVAEFYQAIDREHLTKKLSPERPYVYFTMEVYDKTNGIKGGGGLGVLAADTRRVAETLEIPFVCVTPFYRHEYHQGIYGLDQTESIWEVNPEEYGFEYLDDVEIYTEGMPPARLNVFQKIFSSTRFLTIGEANFGELYAGDGSGDHRLYQEVSLGFGGYAALKMVGLRPAVIQLNETATIFAAVARLDELVRNGMNLYEAIVYVRKHTLYTNHTLVQAAESEFSYDQFSRIVMPNIKSKALKTWLSGLFRDGRLKLSTLTIELAEAKNGVSRLHARVADYQDVNGDKVKFRAVTNGIDLDTWVIPEIVSTYNEKGIIDKFGLPSDDYKERLGDLKIDEIRNLRKIGREKLNQVLAHRQDQYGNPVHIPEDATVFDFKRRFVSYKRPLMPFEDISILRRILEENNAHYILTGKVHQGDTEMRSRLNHVLKLIDGDDLLRERVHYIQDYDEELGFALAAGSDIAINNPIVGLEACGTSFMKDIANLKVLISTADGGVADLSPPACLEIVGANYEAEVRSLYEQMLRAARIVKNDTWYEGQIHRQLAGYLPVISGARMMKDYLQLIFGK
ncbi:MAG: glycogen/starch/alpha-glucan phosphorylase [Candidatus Sacchiramonaceae bacterium]|nr:glycogen/starch/alpha-glucan phosphorylase [Candidatus Saccharimonadaceae bacterium]